MMRILENRTLVLNLKVVIFDLTVSMNAQIPTRPHRGYSQPLIHLSLLLAFASAATAAELQAADGVAGDSFGGSASLSGSMGLAGAQNNAVNGNYNQGAAYLFRNLDSSAAGTFVEDIVLSASDGAGNDRFGNDVSLSGQIGLVGASEDRVGSKPGQGSAYVFRDLDTATGSITENLKLTSSDGGSGDNFGFAVSLDGSTGLASAQNDDIGINRNQGSAYLFRNLDTAVGTITETTKLTASDGGGGDNFGSAVSLSGTIGMIGAVHDSVNANIEQGSAYIFRNLGNATGTIVENARLLASDGSAHAYFGYAVSLSGNMGIAGATWDDAQFNNQGAVYVFRNLDIATGVLTQNLKLSASDGAANDHLGGAVSLSGGLAVAGASNANLNRGAAYVFGKLDLATGAAFETVKIVASDGVADDYFGYAVSLSGDSLLIGTLAGDGLATNTGKAYSGSVAAMTTLDEGNSSRTISGLGFTSRGDWVVGETTDFNQVTLGADDSADVTGPGRSVYIGRAAGADGNVLSIAGTLATNEIQVGSPGGNSGNVFQLEQTANFTATAIRLAPGNSLSVAGDFTEIQTLLDYLGSTALQVWSGAFWQTIDSGNFLGLIEVSLLDGHTSVHAPASGFSQADLTTALSEMQVKVRRSGSVVINGNATVGNSGDASAADFRAQFFVSDDAIYDASDPLLESVADVTGVPAELTGDAVITLNPDATYGPQTFQIILSKNAARTLRNKFLLLRADSSDLILESDETNNTAVFSSSTFQF